MFRVEFLRIFGKKKIYIIILIAIICEVLMALPVENDMPEGFNEDIYRYYMDKLKGMYTPEKQEWIMSEYNRLTELTANEEEYERRYRESEINADEYRTLTKEIKSAHNRLITVEYIVNKSNEYGKCGGKPEYFYDIGVENYICNMSIDFIMIIVLIILVAPIYTEEYTCGTVYMIKSSGNGKGKLLLRRIALTLLVAGIVGTVFPIIELITKYMRYDFGNLHADISSISGLQGIKISMTIQTYIIVTIVVRCIYTMVLSVLVIAVAFAVHNDVVIMAIVSLIVAIPYFLDNIIPSSVSFWLIHNGLGAYRFITGIL